MKETWLATPSELFIPANKSARQDYHAINLWFTVTQLRLIISRVHKTAQLNSKFEESTSINEILRLKFGYAEFTLRMTCFHSNDSFATTPNDMLSQQWKFYNYSQIICFTKLKNKVLLFISKLKNNFFLFLLRHFRYT